MQKTTGPTLFLEKGMGSKGYILKQGLVMVLLFMPLIPVTIQNSPKVEARTLQRNTDDLVRQSRFIFIGTVRRFNAATMRGIPVTESTAIVKVDEVLHRPGTLDNLTGQEITVQFARPQSMKVGQQAVFFTNGLLYGESIVVAEVGHLSAGRDSSLLRRDIEASLQKIADTALSARLVRAALVVSGRVSEIRPAPERAQRPPDTEHNPEWRQAVVEIETAEKGTLSEKTVVILFPASYDEVWMVSPKFQVGQRGIWILQKDQDEKGWPLLRLPGYTALNPLDFQPIEQLDRIRRVLKSHR